MLHDLYHFEPDKRWREIIPKEVFQLINKEVMTELEHPHFQWLVNAWINIEHTQWYYFEKRTSWTPTSKPLVQYTTIYEEV